MVSRKQSSAKVSRMASISRAASASRWASKRRIISLRSKLLPRRGERVVRLPRPGDKCLARTARPRRLRTDSTPRDTSFRPGHLPLEIPHLVRPAAITFQLRRPACQGRFRPRPRLIGLFPRRLSQFTNRDPGLRSLVIGPTKEVLMASETDGIEAVRAAGIQAVKAARNHSLLREVNERVFVMADSSGTTEFVCECGTNACTQTIHPSLVEYERIRSSPMRFVIAVGHDF